MSGFLLSRATHHRSKSIAADDSDALFGDVERRSESLLAYLRLLALAALVAIYWMSGTDLEDHTLMFSLGGFALITVSGLMLSLVGFFRPWLPWVLATADVLLLAHCLAMFAASSNLPFSQALSMPGASFIYLFLASAVIRLRPALVLYTGLLFIGAWIWVLPTSALGRGLSGAFDAGLHGDLARLAVVGLTTMALFFAARRTRRALRAAISELRMRTNLSRFFSPRLVEHIAKADHTLRQARIQHAAVIFADLRDFSRMTEGVPPQETAALLNEYRLRLSGPISAHGGMVDKFIGDCVMAVFGVPDPLPRDAANALECGAAILAAVRDWNAERLAAGKSKIAVGIGIHYGEVLAGALGGKEHLEFTVIGDTVNIAERLERLTRDNQTDLLVSAQLLSAAERAEADVSGWRELPKQPLRGRRGEVRFFRRREGGPVMAHGLDNVARPDADNLSVSAGVVQPR